MTYRVATDKDYERILRIREEAKARIIAERLNVWNDGYPPLDMLRSDIRDRWGRVIEQDGEVIAYAALHESEAEYPKDTFLRPHLLSFGRLMVADAHLGQHVASYLIDRMIEEARETGYAGIGIGVDDCNARALRIYLSRGFIHEGFFKYTFADLDTYVLYFDK